ncbi:MAG: DUF512 domain-containing protein [Selenomonadaceae bacterium]|nr:DUF512 domain-containing protein [Selenomonadaceae bacterium]
MKISNIEENSLAQKIGLVIGDKILQVNGKKLRDIIDFSFEFAEEKIEILIEHADGSRELKSLDKDVDEELGAEFESAVFDGIKICKNHCVFCFVDMIAPNMRKTLSVKDDDYRLSFLYGNFITLTNLTDDDFKRIKNFHLSPLYISIHAMNPAVREKLMRTPLAAKIQTQLDKLDRAGVEYHTQVVLCPNLNDGDELNFTIEEILKRRPNALSLAIVPVGVTKYRRDKFPLTQFDKAGALKVIQQVEKFQRQLRGESGETFIYLADEFYFLAELEMPPVEFYDDFPQIENGIGMTRNFIEEFNAENIPATSHALQAIDIICGTSIAKVLKKLVDEEIKKNPNLDARILPVENKFFGGGVNVSGLLTGGDIIDTLKKFDRPRDKILIPATAIRFGENVFLDDVSLDDLQKIFPAQIIPISNGAEFRKVLSGN